MKDIERILVDWFEANGAIVTHNREDEWVLAAEEDYSLTALAVAIGEALKSQPLTSTLRPGTE